MPKKNRKEIPEIGQDETTLYDMFMEQIDFGAMDPTRRRDLATVFMMLLACVDDDNINTNKMAMLLQKLGEDEAE